MSALGINPMWACLICCTCLLGWSMLKLLFWSCRWLIVWFLLPQRLTYISSICVWPSRRTALSSGCICGCTCVSAFTLSVPVGHSCPAFLFSKCLLINVFLTSGLNEEKCWVKSLLTPCKCGCVLFSLSGKSSCKDTFVKYFLLVKMFFKKMPITLTSDPFTISQLLPNWMKVFSPVNVVFSKCASVVVIVVHFITEIL